MKAIDKRYIFAFVSVVLFLFLFLQPEISAHPSETLHNKDIWSVFPFDDGPARKNNENKAIGDWIELISKWQIDERFGEPNDELNGEKFGDYIKSHFHFSVNQKEHRLFFHWPYNSRPWTDALASYIERQNYSWGHNPDSLKLFQEALKIEQARRNKVVNNRTSEVFQFSKGGKEGSWANAFAAIVYDVHLLGDWVPEDNKYFEGVAEPREIAKDLIKNIQRVDNITCYSITKSITFATNAPSIDNGLLAKKLLTILQLELPIFLIECQNGSIKRRLEKLGYVFKYHNRVGMEQYNSMHPDVFKYR